MWKLSREILDTRRYEQVQANAGAAVYDGAVSERDYRYDCLTTFSWANRFSEPFLDFGCGVGVASEVFERLGKQVVAFDASREMLRFAKRRSSVPLVLADALNLPFRDKVFSTTCIVGVLHHIQNLDGAFSEIARCTEGVVCMNEPCPRPSFVMRVILLAVYCVQVFQRKIGFRRKGSVVKGEYKSRYERPLDPRMLIRLAKKNGFELAQLRYFNHIPLLNEFLSEKSRIRLFSALISSKNGTDAEIVVASSHLLHGGGFQ